MAGSGISVNANTITCSSGDSGVYLYQDVAAANVLITQNVITGATTSTNAGESTGIFATDDPSFFGEASGGATFATVTENLIDGFSRGIDLYRNASAPSGGATVQLTITSNNEIRNGTTGIRVFDANGQTAANAVALITNNGPSIHGNVVGIDVDGGTATITGNHIYGNTSAGVRIANAGTATINSNNFDGPTPDNATEFVLNPRPPRVAGSPAARSPATRSPATRSSSTTSRPRTSMRPPATRSKA